MAKNPDGKKPESAPREVSARKALLASLKLKSKSELQAIVRKLQQLGKGKGPNDPDLS